MSGDHEFNVKDKRKKKIAVLTLSSAMVLAMVVAVTVGIKETGHTDGIEGDDDHDGLATSTRAAKSVCHTVEYRRACERTLAHVHTSDPKKLVQTTFNAALEKLEGALANSSNIKPSKDDHRGEEALETCKEVVEYAVADLKRSIDQMGHFEIHNKEEHVENMRIWLSGVMTYQDTCIDAFENTTGDAGDKMKKLLNTSREFSSNGLDVASGLSTILESLNLPVNPKHHRLLSEEQGKGGEEEELPHWVDMRQRMLLHEEGANVKADVVVAKDGSGKYKTIAEALKEVPVVKDINKVATSSNNKTFVIYIKEGIYEEEIQVKTTMTHVMFIGDGPTKTIITGNKSFADGFVLYKTATVSIMGSHFIGKNIGFENSAGAQKHQAVALLVQSDNSIFYNCHINGYMSTLCAHSYRHFYRHCTISGTVDFIFGNAAAVFQNCKLVIRNPLDNQQPVITAQSRVNNREPTGFVLQNCTVMADPLYYPVRATNKAFLGRPAKKYSRVVFMQSYLGDSVAPQGWKPWMGTFGEHTCEFGEFENRGPAAGLSGRVKWRGVRKVGKEEAVGFTAGKFYGGDRWIRPSGVPYVSGIMSNLS